MTFLEHALSLARQGFYVFPIAAGKKTPPKLKDWQMHATRDDEHITTWWSSIWSDCNVGVCTTRYGSDTALVVVDVDNKGSKRGDDEIIRLEFDGFEFPATYEQTTPTGGRHLVYSCETPVKQGANVLGPGLDIRSRGGYIVGAGSSLKGLLYTGSAHPVTRAPQWIVERCGVSRRQVHPNPSRVLPGVDPVAAAARATEYLRGAPVAVEGDAGDQTTYRVACRVRDFGVGEEVACSLMLDNWNERCSPPWAPENIETKVKNAYAYAASSAGNAAPEAYFSPVEAAVPGSVPLSEPGIPTTAHPFDALNRDFAFVLAGGGHHILWETHDVNGRNQVVHLTETAFHKRHASQTMQVGKRSEPITELWMKAPQRRGYDAICFDPSKSNPPQFYNLWKGFSVDPGTGPREPLEMFLDHAKTNICRNQASLFDWLMGWFAHLIQRPAEKPLVACVFRGGKGVGKNALIERVGYLLGGHFLVTSNRRYLISNFNGHLESLLLFALDEAFWSGDKQAEGTLKDLITGEEHVIEHKGKETFSVANRTRVAIIGNESWIVPASHDERRFAVFDVGDGRKQDRQFFHTMREGMERGGYRVLLRYLLDHHITTDVNDAPQTNALRDQKIASLDPVHQWWLDSLTDGRVRGADFDSGGWPSQVETERVRAAYRRYLTERQIKARSPEERAFGHLIHQCLPSIVKTNARISGELRPVYRIPELELARAEFATFLGHEMSWETH